MCYWKDGGNSNFERLVYLQDSLLLNWYMTYEIYKDFQYFCLKYFAYFNESVIINGKIFLQVLFNSKVFQRVPKCPHSSLNMCSGQVDQKPWQTCMHCPTLGCTEQRQSCFFFAQCSSSPLLQKSESVDQIPLFLHCHMENLNNISLLMYLPNFFTSFLIRLYFLLFFNNFRIKR